MIYRLAADSVVLFHLLFILFVLLGGVFVLRWSWMALLHVPAMLWGVAVEFLHLYCPLTPLENALRSRAGEQGYEGGFIEHYLIPLIYPAALTPQIQLWLGGIVVLINASIYGVLLVRGIRRLRHG
ncbi:hypothetical protein BZK31_19215 [Pseudomonas floridensis]|uniref:DUF2784 domain-containing protein n=1 Tax=Pseudomonas floridensis TaxID=1958950 RepID=A0A1X0N2M0_9PSED|nr:DUF2784 domain-containing protein [Pseudomonas floridensis]ORC57551.1 hypothetical protein BZK31_19215 [Pseudomonas floridensis]